MSDLVEAFKRLKAEAAVRRSVKGVLAADDGHMDARECQAAYEKLSSVIKENGAEAFAVWACPSCGQKNRVDKALVIAYAARPRCGKCKTFLRGTP